MWNRRFFIVLMLLGMVSNTWADGLRIGSRIDRRGVVQRSTLILVVKVIETGSVYRNRRAYGRTHRYLAVRRARVQIQRVLRGKLELLSHLPKLKRLWLDMRSYSVPGKWVGIEHHYPSKYSFSRTKPGDTFVAYLPHAHVIAKRSGGYAAWIRYVDPISAVSSLKTMIPFAIQKEKRRWRKGSPCKILRTWSFRGACKPLRLVRRAIRCPKHFALRMRWSRHAPYITCENQKKRFHGPYYQWHRNGMLAIKMMYRNHRVHGITTAWHKNGRLQNREVYLNGVRHGAYKGWHANGTLRVQGTFFKGKQHGRWLLMRRNGKLRLGQCWRRGTLLWKTKQASQARKRTCR